MTTPTGPVLQPGQSISIDPPIVGLTVAGTTIYQGTAGLGSVQVSAAPLPPKPSDPMVTDLQKKANASGVLKTPLLEDGVMGQFTHDALAGFIPLAPVPPKILRLGSSTPPSGVSGARIETATQGLETSLGTPVVHLDSHRTYYLWNTSTSGLYGLDQVLAADAAAGRDSYVSLKPPGGGLGGCPDVISQTAAVVDYQKHLYAILAKYSHRIWFTFFHEPENDPGAAARGKVQQATRDLYRKGSDVFVAAMRGLGTGLNVLFGPTFMHYSLTPAGANDWGHVDLWLPMIYDFIAFDDYNFGFQADLDYAVAHGTILAIGEHAHPASTGLQTEGLTAFSHAELGHQGDPMLDPHRYAVLHGRIEGASVDTQLAYAQQYTDFVNANATQIGAVCWWNVVAMQQPTLDLLGAQLRAAA